MQKLPPGPTKTWLASPQIKARFIDPMLLLRTNRLPEGADWKYEIKLDGYRAIAFKSGGRVHLRSRNDKDFAGKYAAIVKALSSMPDETVIDSELVAPDEGSRPSFNALQKLRIVKDAAALLRF